MKNAGKPARIPGGIFCNNTFTFKNVNVDFNIDWKCLMAISIPFSLMLIILLVILLSSPEFRELFTQALISRFQD